MSQIGGVNPLQNIISTVDSPYKLLYGALLVILIVYSPMIPREYRNFADSVLGRVFGVAVVYAVVYFFGWVYGLFTALSFVLILHGSLRIENVAEGFNGGGSINEKDVIGKRWFVEKILGERPKRIETDKVHTSAIEGISFGPT